MNRRTRQLQGTRQSRLCFIQDALGGASLSGDVRSDMVTPLFIATERFDPTDGDKWQKYCEWAKIPALVEVVSLDALLCAHIIKELQNEDWQHIVCEDFRLDYFLHLDYLKQRIEGVPRRNVLGLYRNPEAHVTAAPAPGDFCFAGYDLIDEQTQISALTNCGGFPDVFRNDELNSFGLIDSYDRATEVRRLLAERYPEEAHAQCEMYALWRLNESERAHSIQQPLASDFFT